MSGQTTTTPSASNAESFSVQAQRPPTRAATVSAAQTTTGQVPAGSTTASATSSQTPAVPATGSHTKPASTTTAGTQPTSTTSTRAPLAARPATVPERPTCRRDRRARSRRS